MKCVKILGGVPGGRRVGSERLSVLIPVRTIENKTKSIIVVIALIIRSNI